MSKSFLNLLRLLWWIGTIEFYVHVKFNVNWSYCYVVVRGTVMTSGRFTFILLLLLWGWGLWHNFEFLGLAYVAR